MKQIFFETRFGILVQVILFILPFTLPAWEPGIDISTTLTIMSLFFTILVGFFIAATTANYLRMQTLITNENASLVTIYSYARLIEPSAAPKVANAIDEYLIASLDFDNLGHVNATEKRLGNLLAVVDEIHPSNDEGMAMLPYLQTAKSSLIALTREFGLLSKEIVQSRHWFIITVLAIFISFLLLALNTGSFFSSLLVGSLLVVIFQTMNLLYEIDINLFLAKHLNYEEPQYVFTSIGKLPYYPETARSVVKKFPTEYRMGMYRNYPKSFDKVIEVIRKD